MGNIFEIPFNAGQDEGTDRALMPDGVLRACQNCRLTRDGRLEVRPVLTALSSATYSTATLVPYDVANFGGRLVALGDQCSQNRPTDLFEWNAARSKWRATAGDDTNISTGQRLPRLTDVRQLAQLPDLPESIHTAGLAAGAGYVCAVYERLGATASVVHIVDSTTDQTVLVETFAVKRPVVVYSGADFWIVGIDSDEDIVMTRFAPLTDETLAATATLASNATTVNDVHVATCGSGGWVMAYATTASALVFRYDNSGVQQTTWTAFASATNSIALACNSAGSIVSVARQDSSQLYFLSSFDAAGTPLNGPTALFGGAGGSGHRLGLALAGTDLKIVGVDELNSRALFQSVTQSTHSLGGAEVYFDARPEGAPVAVGSDVFIGFVDLTATNFTLGTYHVVDVANFLPQCFVAAQLCDTTATSANEIQSMAADGTVLYFCVISVGQDNGTFSGLKYRAVIYRAETRGTDRRQMAQIGGELLIAGGLPLTYDGRTLVEQGFSERPVVQSAAEGTTGALTALGVYNGVPVWEVYDGKGRGFGIFQSSSKDVSITAESDGVSMSITTPHSLRRHPSFADQGQTIRVSLYRTEAGEGIFFLDSQVTIALTDDLGEPMTITSTASDAQIIDNLVLYEQSQTPISHVGPGPYSYVHAARERALAGGLPDPEAWRMSKLLFPSEPLEWAPNGQLGNTGRVGQPITAVGAFETAGLIWTEQEIWLLPGRGPERNGVGEFEPATSVATPGGAYDWRSVLVAPPGAFFQMRPDRIMLLGRDTSVTGVGGPVEETLTLFPDIVGVVFVRDQEQVVFACNNTAGTDAVLLVYDLATGQWFVDTLTDPVKSISELDGRLVLVQGTSVFLQELTAGVGAGALPTMRVTTGSFRPFSALGYGDVVKIGLLGTYLGDCTVDTSISFDDGKTWTSMGEQVVTAAAWTNAITGLAIAAGDPITLLYTPNVRCTDRFSIRVVVTHETNTGGIRLHVLSFEVEAQEGMVRRAARDHR